jgi:hypothetical protein
LFFFGVVSLVLLCARVICVCVCFVCVCGVCVCVVCVCGVCVCGVCVLCVCMWCVCVCGVCVCVVCVYVCVCVCTRAAFDNTRVFPERYLSVCTFLTSVNCCYPEDYGSMFLPNVGQTQHNTRSVSSAAETGHTYFGHVGALSYHRPIGTGTCISGS